MFHLSFEYPLECSSGTDEDDEEALMQRALELSLRDMSTEEGATYSTDRDAMVTSDAAEEDEVRKRSGEEGVERAREKEREREREKDRKSKKGEREFT